MKKTEQKASDAILQTPKEIEFGDRTYQVAPPTVATLIQTSKYISEIPLINTDTKDVLGETLAKAKDMKVIGRLFAVLILGCKEPKRAHETAWDRIISLLKKKPVDPEEELANYINHNITPRQLNKILSIMFQQMQVADFFALIASLTEVNLLRATKEAMETTASGQPSPESQKPII